MTISHDAEKGWAESDGEPRWRATQAALARLNGAEVRWLVRPHRAHVAHLADGTPIATLRYNPPNRRWAGRIEGYAFWGHNRVLGYEHYMDVRGFDRVAEARRFIEDVLRQSGAVIRRR